MTDEHTVATGSLPCPVVILTVSGRRRDAMTATAVFVSEDPPWLSVSVAEHLLTHDLLEETGEFVVNLATVEQLEMVRQLGSIHGRDVDKFEHFQIATEPSEVVAAPRIAGSHACLECRVVASHAAACYRVYIGEVVAHVANGEWSPLIWHQGRYFTLSGPVP